MSVIVVILVMLLLLLIRVPVGFAIAIAGTLGLYIHGGLSDVLGVLQSAPADAVSSYSLSPIPLFILMAQFVVASGVMDDLFEATRVWVGRIRGGAGIAATGAGAMFAAVSGSSTAAAATLAHTSTTKMIESGYSPRISTGLVSVVGTLAAMVPPSIILVFYAILAEESVGQVLVAGFLPGALVTVALIVTLLILIKADPASAPPGQRHAWADKLRNLKSAGPVLLLFALVTGTVYFGIATPTEAAALGAVGGFALLAARGRASWQTIRHAITETISSSVMILMIILGAHILGYFITSTRVTPTVVSWVASLDVAPVVVIIVLALCYIVLGFFLDQIAILALTVPVVLPLVTELGYDPIWFGVLIVLLAEIGLVSPPLGLNVFVVARTARRPAAEVFWGALPFVLAVVAVAALLIAFPEIVLWIPDTMSATE
ncbi:TRAP transporter large permease [Prauserella muralis]|uniref:C4-dicarboxylate ABC transporter permease n=1 Tax=Prauserella muralis TaxID=588067 RepID=A0A2V4AZI9_9PSEU|nr:TRAP transporter large permease [Prauserella muralis]PXY27292.1 C4-dicarboxylate ABC transporter permease [Prauserella muralis]TWE23034.1 tripartite ATP-independent transporter DctM subunit [Prauserella muralis]